MLTVVVVAIVVVVVYSLPPLLGGSLVPHTVPFPEILATGRDCTKSLQSLVE